MTLCICLGGCFSLPDDCQPLHIAESLRVDLCSLLRDINVHKIRAVGKGVPADGDGIIRELDICEGTADEGLGFDSRKRSREDEVRSLPHGIEFRILVLGKAPTWQIRRCLRVRTFRPAEESGAVSLFCFTSGETAPLL